MTDKNIDDLIKEGCFLLKAASKGPWMVQDASLSGPGSNESYVGLATFRDSENSDVTSAARIPADANAKLAAFARNHLGDLLDELYSLRRRSFLL